MATRSLEKLAGSSSAAGPKLVRVPPGSPQIEKQATFTVP